MAKRHKALTLINGEYAYVNRDVALQHGVCYCCGELLKNHPADRAGYIPLNRHHQVFESLEGVYQEVTGSPFPATNQNIFWTGMGCHIALHQEIDPIAADIAKIAERKHFQSLHSISEIDSHLEMVNICRKFLSIMRKKGFGENYRDSPAPLPNYSSYAATH